MASPRDAGGTTSAMMAPMEVKARAMLNPSSTALTVNASMPVEIPNPQREAP